MKAMGEQKIETIKKILRARRDGILSEIATLIAIEMIVDPLPLTKGDIVWGQQIARKLGL